MSYATFEQRFKKIPARWIQLSIDDLLKKHQDGLGSYLALKTQIEIEEDQMGFPKITNDKAVQRYTKLRQRFGEISFQNQMLAHIISKKLNIHE